VRGNHIRVGRLLSGVRAYYHHGIYIADDEVIHFSSAGHDNLTGAGNEIIKTGVNQFHRGNRIEVKIYTEKEHPYPVEAIVHWARACIGEDGYCLFSNNCEHFASFCTLGSHRSHQVEKFISRIMGGSMGWLGDIGRAIFGGGSSSRDSSITTYEPDKVRIAEIEASAKIKLAGMEHERIRLYTDSQLELLEFNAKMEAAIIEANVRGEKIRQDSLRDLYIEINIIGQQRLEMLANCSSSIIKEMEKHYQQLSTELKSEDNAFIEEKLIKLNELLDQYEVGTAQHKIYVREIDKFCCRHDSYITERLKWLGERQAKALVSFIADKEQINSHINLLVEQRLEQIGMPLQAKQASLPSGQSIPQINQRRQIVGPDADAAS
jgi:hypothetical protein